MRVVCRITVPRLAIGSESSACAPVSAGSCPFLKSLASREKSLTLGEEIALFRTLAAVTARDLSCLVPTLCFGRVTAYAPPPRAMKTASVAMTFAYVRREQSFATQLTVPLSRHPASFLSQQRRLHPPDHAARPRPSDIPPIPIPYGLLARVDCSRVVRSVVSSLDASLGDSGATVVVDELPPVQGDARELELLFRHLISNAIRFADAKPLRIEVSATHDQDSVWFSVIDN